MALELTPAGGWHGPALVAIVSGLPAGLVLDKAAIDADLARRQQGYGRSPRQQLEQDEVAGLAGLRQGPTLAPPSVGGGASGRLSRWSSATATTRTGRGGWARGRRRASRRARARSRSRF